jgi:outer membrane receptor protein involved in Fe transport
MEWRVLVRGLVTIFVFGMLVERPAFAQITTGTVTGTVKDEQGLAVPGATVTLVSDARGTKTAPAVTGANGEFVIPNVTADTYSLEVALEGFRPIHRTGVIVSGGDRVALPAITLTVGSATETITVVGETPLVQAQSGERSFSISTEAVQAIAVNGRNFNNLTNLAPGVVAGTVNGLRANQNTLQIDGITSVDTGNNGNAVTLTVDAVQEVRVLTTSYQAEYGRSAGAQISAVTKSGTQRFRGSIYADRRKDDLNANTWLNNARGLPKQKINQSDEGYTLGGPIGRPNSGSRFFFFVNQEWQQVLTANNETRVRVPTALERSGDFSQTLDNAGRLYNLIRDPLSAFPCTATDTRGCFADGGVLGRIPQDRLYGLGLRVLNMYPTPNSPDTAAQGYNYVSQDSSDQPRRQDLLRLDWQASDRWRFNGKWLHTGGTNVTPYGGGTTGFSTNLPQFGSTNPCPCSSQWTIAATGTLSNTLVTELSFGSSNRPITNYALNPDLLSRSALGLSAFPMLYPNAVQQDLVPSFVFSGAGSRIATANAPTNNTQYGPFENNNTSYDLVASLTKLFGSHTAKTGIFMNRAAKEQSSRAAANGIINFANDPSNPFDSGFPYANAALGVYQSYTQAADWIKGNFLYHNIEWYLQDNWRVNSRLTLDYGLRFYWLQPTYDTRLQASNFIPAEYSAARAPRLYYPTRDAAGNRVGIDRATGALVPAFNIGRIVPGSGALVGNGLFGAGDGIDEQLYENRGVHYAPRFGFAYDARGTQELVVRGGFGVFYDRAAGDTVYGMIEQQPTLVQPNLF